MRHFWSGKMLSVNASKPIRKGGAKYPNSLRQIAAILQNNPSTVSRILSQLQRCGSPATCIARQVALTAIASRCGDSVSDGIFFLEMLSLPVFPVKFCGPALVYRHAPTIDAPNRMLLQGYKGFKSPLPPLKALPEQHSFVDLFEQLLLCSRKPSGGESILRNEGARLGTVVIAGLTAQATIEHCGFMEIVKYSPPEESAGARKDIAQVTGKTILLLAAITENLWQGNERPQKRCGTVATDDKSLTEILEHMSARPCYISSCAAGSF
jgi:hypothetical protein